MAFPPNGGAPAPARPPMPPAGGPPMPPSGGPPGPAAPQAQAQAVASAFHNEVLNRLRKLAPQEKQTLIAGITPNVALVLKKVLPELADIIDQVVKPAAAPMGGAPMPMPGGAMPPPAGGPPAMKPQTSLSKY